MSDTQRDYSQLTREELEARLDAAEDACVMFGWTAAHFETDKDKAAHELWRKWLSLPGTSCEPANNKHLSKSLIAELARQRDDRRNELLAKLNEQ